MSPVVSRLPRVIHLLVVQFRVPLQHAINYGVVLFEGAKQILLLHEVKSDGLVPFESADLFEKVLVLLGSEDLESKEDEAD